jgi:hypothetical protein
MEHPHTQNVIEPVTMSEVLSLASWDRPRSTEELRDFISHRESAIGL